MIELPFFAGLPVAVMGLGKSGLAAARALQRSEAEVWAWDDSEDRRAEAREREIPLVDLHRCNWAEVPSLVLSPGIPDRYPEPHPVAAAARDAGAEIIGDIELLGRACPDASYVGITGTNGKSTTTALIGHIFHLSGRSCEVGGNLGPSVMEFEMFDSSGSYVLEMSSYQLERTYSITFDVAVLLNVSPDHLDRHNGLEGYIAAKRNIFRRQTAPRAAVVGVDDAHSRKIYKDLAAAGDQTVIAISGEGPVAGGIYVENGVLFDDTDGEKVPALPLSEVATLPGLHNAQNAVGAAALCSELGIPDEAIVKGLLEFAGVGRRFSDLGEVRWKSGSARLIDDYGHHPTEVAVTLQAARDAFAGQRVVMVYQPHRFTRTRDHFDEFVSVLGEAQCLILLDVYSAGEVAIEGADSQSLAKAIRSRGVVEPIVVSDQRQLAAVLAGVMEDADILLMQGAGDIGRLAGALADCESLEVLQ